MSFAAVKRWTRLPSDEKSVSNIWINEDIRPLPPIRRTWTVWTFTSFWTTNQVAISNWQLGGALVASGLSVWQAMISIILGKCIVAAVAIFNGYVGAEWHVGFPVVSRYIWGVRGQFILLIQRIILSLVWFAVQSWTGGICVSVILGSIFPSFQNIGNVFSESSHLETKQFVGWILFNVILIPVLYIRPEKMKGTLLVFNIISAVTLISMMIWSLAVAKGAGELLSQGNKAMSSEELGWGITSGVSTVIGSIAVGLTNQPDYSRFARRPGDQIFGQWFAIIFMGTLFPLFGCLTASATQAYFGEAVWNPPVLSQLWLDTSYSSGARAGAFFTGVGLLICQVAINTVDNAFSAGMDMAALCSSYINIRRGAYIGLILSIALCPWELLSSAGVFISVLSAYSVFLGPVIGIQVCDYWFIRRRRIKLSDLYHPRPEGIYYFYHGFNWRSFLAWVLGFWSQLPGFAQNVTPGSVTVSKGWTNIYNLAFLVGFAISFSTFYVFNYFWPPVGLGEIDEYDVYDTFTPEEAARLGVTPSEGSTVVVEDDGRSSVHLVQYGS
ncbi:NCS1 nucleoside transporter [Coniochaeta ligniaria NRRL 30616]|uniref:NCS1 nucleoside transporter n=1 Tax=Coniochaeta ligniaria NRRL 30616 TaxID=1408157 RepID=A0A1J7J3X6_9PEZI|nr:NCS1 nucleoside transporter [Coniochaeta ligniaria NRRL 30616]